MNNQEKVYDYYVERTKKVRELLKEYDEKLLELEKLEKEKKKADKRGKKEIEKLIETEKENLRCNKFEITEPHLMWALSLGFVDDVSIWWLAREKKKDQQEEYENCPRHEDARNVVYIPQVEALYMEKPEEPIEGISFNPNFLSLPSPHWLGLEVKFKLLTPWYSKDDRFFHLMDNPVRKDRVFGVPFMSPASWKGMLRWACRMQAGLLEYLKDLKDGKTTEDWLDDPRCIHLFGNEKGEKERFRQGALVFYPTWFNRVGFEVINPHDRESKAGTHPIYYEVVPPETEGTLYLLYAPWPGMEPSFPPNKVLPGLFKAIHDLLTKYGISAKRSVGWGTAEIAGWKAYHKVPEKEESNEEENSDYKELWENIRDWFSRTGQEDQE